MVDWGQCPAVEWEAEELSGTWVFKGTRVPVDALFENLQNGASVDEFLNRFPDVTREQVEAVFAYVQQSLAAAAMDFVGGIEGSNPNRAGNARSEVKARIARRHALSRHGSLEKRATRGSREKFLAAIAKVPDKAPDPGDEL